MSAAVSILSDPLSSVRTRKAGLVSLIIQKGKDGFSRSGDLREKVHPVDELEVGPFHVAALAFWHDGLAIGRHAPVSYRCYARLFQVKKTTRESKAALEQTAGDSMTRDSKTKDET